MSTYTYNEDLAHQFFAVRSCVTPKYISPTYPYLRSFIRKYLCSLILQIVTWLVMEEERVGRA